MKSVQEILDEKICPICHEGVYESDYLNRVFRDAPKVNYIAHMVTHYRHHHIEYWNRCWGPNGRKYRQSWFGDYDEERRIVNERAKRQIIKKGKETLKRIGIKPKHFKALQYTEEKTMELANKILG